MSFAAPGVLDVLVDGKTIFSFLAQRRTPDRGEIVKLIHEARQSSGVSGLTVTNDEGLV